VHKSLYLQQYSKPLNNEQLGGKMPLEINELKQRIHELKAITEQFSSGGTLAAKDVTGLVETILREVFHHAFPCLEETDQQIILKAIEKLDNNKVGVERFTFGHLNNLFNQTQFFEKYVKALQTRVEVVELINLTKFVQLRNKLIHKDAQLSKIEAKFLIQCLELFVDTFMTEETITKSSIFYVPRSRNEYFTGREEILKELHHKLQQNQVVALNQKAPSVALHGLGGIGKTQTLIEYAYQCRDKNSYQAILWMSADSQESFEASIRTLAFELALPIEGKPFDEIRKSVKNWFQQHRDWLLLIDNADELNLIKDFLSKIKGSGQILISTRAQSTRPFAEPIEIEKMTDKEAFKFLEKRTGLAIDQHAKELVKLLDNLPLALDQAAAYLQGGKSFKRYIEIYQSRQLDLLKRRGKTSYSEDHPDPIAITWLVSFEKVKENPLASQILNSCAFLYPDGITQEIFDEFDPLEYDDAIDAILNYSLLKRDDQKGLLFMHRLVQTVLRAQLSQEEQHQIATDTVKLVLAGCPNDEKDFTAWLNRNNEWLLNAREAEHWINRFQLQFKEVGELLNDMGYYLEKIAQYEQALPLYLRALEILEKVLGKEHPDVATSLNNLAMLYNSQGKYEEALPLYLRALEIWEKVLGKEHPNVATSLNNLALLYDDQGKYEEALPLYLRALEIFEKALGKEHPLVATSLNNLAELYRNQGKYEEALPLHLRALEIWEKVLGKEHPDVATSLNNLAGLYYSQGKYEEALPLSLRALEIREKVLGKEHPDVAQSLNNLAELYRNQEKYEEALPLYLRALEIKEKVLGKEHPDVATSLNNLANLYYHQGKYEEALPLHLRALEIWEKVLGKEHPDVAESLNNLALLYKNQGKYEEALPLYLRALEIFEKVLGKEHPHVATSLNDLANLYFNQGKYEEALPLYKESVRIFTKVLGAQHPNTKGVKANYESCLEEMK